MPIAAVSFDMLNTDFRSWSAACTTSDSRPRLPVRLTSGMWRTGVLLPAMVSWSALTNTSRLSPSVRGGRTGFPSSKRWARSPAHFRAVPPRHPLAWIGAVLPQLAGRVAFARRPASFSSSEWFPMLQVCKPAASENTRIRTAILTLSTTLSTASPMPSMLFRSVSLSVKGH
jgi:hypothetical protein